MYLRWVTWVEVRDWRAIIQLGFQRYVNSATCEIYEFDSPRNLPSNASMHEGEEMLEQSSS